MLERNGDAEHWKSMGKISSAIERVYIPSVIAFGVAQTLFLAQNVVPRPLRANPLADQSLRFAICNCDQVGFALVLDFNALAEVLHQESTGFAANRSHAGQKGLCLVLAHNLESVTPLQGRTLRSQSRADSSESISFVLQL